MCIYAITIMHKMYIHFAKNQTKNRASIFDIFLVPNKWDDSYFCLLFFLQKNWNPHLFSHEKEKPRKETLFLKYVCVIQNFSGRREKESDLNFIET